MAQKKSSVTTLLSPITSYSPPTVGLPSPPLLRRLAPRVRNDDATSPSPFLHRLVPRRHDDMTAMTKGARSHTSTRRPWFITATVIIAISALNLFKTRKIITFFALPDDFLLLPRIATIRQEDVQHKFPIMIHIRESCASARTIDLDWTTKHRLPTRDNEHWINGEVKEHRALKREVDKGCKNVGKEWAHDYNPNCNTIHASGMEELADSSGQRLNRIVGNGSNRDVWAIHEYDGTPRVLKTVQIDKKFDDLGLFDRNRRDAVASEQLSKSPFVMNIYGHCGYTAIYDFSDGGELSDIFKGETTPTKEELLQIAYDSAAGVADSHLVDKKGRASIAHADIKPAQFLKVNGKYMLNDFNRARFLSWHYKTKKQCGFSVSSNGHGVVSFHYSTNLSSNLFGIYMYLH